MKNKCFFAFGWAALTVAGLGGPARAFWYGNPARPLEKQKSSLDLIYDFGHRDIVRADGKGSSAQLDSRRFTLQWRQGVGRAVQAFARVLPGTGRLNFENSSYNPVLWGGGVGLQFSPPEAMGPVHLGVLGLVDSSFGSKKGASTSGGSDDVSWVEGTAAAGVSVDPVKMLSAYGGLALTKSTVHLSGVGTKSTFEADKKFGGFLGADFIPNEAWRIGAEFHFGNEQILGFSLGYLF